MKSKITVKEQRQIIKITNRLVDIKENIKFRRKIDIEQDLEDENDPINKINDALRFLDEV